MTAATVLSGAALVVAIGTAGWSGWYAQRSNSRREMLKWRREELLRATSELAQLSSHRQAVLAWALDTVLPPQAFGPPIDPFNTEVTGGPHPRHSIDQMAIVVERIELLDQPLAQVARRVADAHREAMLKAEVEYAVSGDNISRVDAMVVETEDLQRLHAELTQAFRRATLIEP